MKDFEFIDHGSVVMVQPLTDAAHTWVDENVSVEGWAWIGPAFACEPRCVENLIDGIIAAGFEI